jgi:hypothetical protein
MYINFAFKFTLRCLQPDIVPIICHWCQQHWCAGVVDTGGKLTPLSTTKAEIVAKFAAGVIDTVNKFANISANFRKN